MNRYKMAECEEHNQNKVKFRHLHFCNPERTNPVFGGYFVSDIKHTLGILEQVI